MLQRKVVLAYSGGLDTSFCIKYLSEEKGLEVHALTVDTGGFSTEELTAMRERADYLGAASFEAVDVTHRLYDQCLRYLVFGNALRYQTYPLSVSAERIFQAIEAVRHARRIGADALAHGSTGAGNDQVRFDLIFNILAPELEVITPIRDLRLSRAEEVAYLAKHGVEWPEKKGRYSVNQGLWGTTVGGAETLTSRHYLPDEAWPRPVTESGDRLLTLRFEQGEFVGFDGQTFDHPVDAIKALEEVAGAYGIGRDIHVGDTIIGIKGRVGFAAAAPLLLIKAHHLLEKHILGKWQFYWKDQLANWYGMMVHEGQLLDPVMRNIEAFLADTQSKVTGDVYVRLYPYRFVLEGIQSPHDLLGAGGGQYGEMNKSWSGEDVKGFTRILSLAGRTQEQVQGLGDWGMSE